MTEERKEELTNKFFSQSLSTAEVDELSLALDQDEAFAAGLRFDIGMAEAIERRRYDKVERQRRQQVRRARWVKITGLVGVVLLLATAVYLVLRQTGPRTQALTPEEGIALLNELLAKSEADRRLGVVAGPESWRDQLANSPVTTDNTEAALSLLVEIQRRDGVCDDSEVAFFRGALEAYIQFDFTTALTQFDCLAQDANYPYLDDAELPSIISLTALGEIDEAKRRLGRTGWPLDTLPPSTRAILGK